MFISLGGSVYAAAKINGKTIKQGSIPADRLKTDSLTGAQIKEASLGTVPRARSADEARTADVAAKALEAGIAAEASSATSADQADRAETADSAKRVRLAATAEEAGDALALSSIAPGDFQRSCRSGSVLAAATVHPDPDGPRAENPEVRSEFNCTDSGISATRAKNAQGVAVNGEYDVDFGPAAAGFAFVSAFGPNALAVVDSRGFGKFRVKVFASSSDQLLRVEPFSIVVLDGAER
ncbi:MAG TPA: hypothetical protein VF081_04225 [Solirubrobacterales bacterium]